MEKIQVSIIPINSLQVNIWNLFYNNNYLFLKNIFKLNQIFS